MKRKLFTLLMAFMALATFQANAVLVWVNAGDTIDVNGTRDNYAIVPPSITSKLTVKDGKFVYVAEQPGFAAADKIDVTNPASNFISFKGSGVTFSLPYGGVTYDRFVVFKGQNAATPGHNIVEAQAFNNGAFDGYLAIQASGYVDDDNLLIVVVDSKGALSLMQYKDYVAGFTPQGSPWDPTNNQSWYHPLYIETNPISGRWARESDFVGCKFYSFEEGPGKIIAYHADEVVKGTKNTPYSVFAVQQVDYVAWEGNATYTNATTNNLIDDNSNASHTYFQQDAKMTGREEIGTQPLGSDYVIPLFTLATPEDNCQVLSVSRQNDLKTQSQADGGYANKLEIRKYGDFYQYDNVSGSLVYTKKTVSDTDGVDWNDSYIYTSLQKFAIWINDDGTFTLYPAAAYFWQYGEQKEPQTDKVLPNSVLIYNKLDIVLESGMGGTDDQNWGTMLGWWNGKLTGSFPNVPDYIGTVPNKLASWSTDYAARKYINVCQDEDADIEGRFFFLQVYPDTVGLGDPLTGFPNAFGPKGYQVGREYVLSTQVYSDGGAPSGYSKKLVIVPKEEVMTKEDEYWRYPYDSVNMAAHWEVQLVKNAKGDRDGFRFINMLGDTLQYRLDNTNLAGAYFVNNSLIPGRPEEIGYFGRPEDVGYAWYDDANYPWFPLNDNPYSGEAAGGGVGTHPSTWTPGLGPNGITWDTWTAHTLKAPYKFGRPVREDAFFLELIFPQANVEIGLAPNSTWYYPNGEQIGATPTANYIQQDVSWVEKNNSNDIKTYHWLDIPSCHGMLISLEEIYYVPKYGPYYGGADDKDVINTNDPTFQYQDSLTAYSFLTGSYDLYEAAHVENGLKLSYQTVDIYDGKGTKVNAARLLKTDAVDILEFIPLAQTNKIDILKNRTIEEQDINWGPPIGATYDNEIDYVYEETYKWYLIKLGDKYLTFDTVNLAAGTNREKVGLVFEASEANALPIRLYQPLVGDKKEDNFLLQFYLPKYTYYYQKNSDLWWAYENEFPAIEEATTGTIPGGVEVCFASLSNQSDYIYATKAFTGRTTGTRFSWNNQDNPVCPCPNEFLDPSWMGEERLLNLPLNNQIWVEELAVDAWIATGENNRAIVSNETADDATTLTHTYVTTIREYSQDKTPNAPQYYWEPGVAKVPIAYGTAVGDTTWIRGFQTDLDVPLYYIQNDEGKYLTVIPHTYMRDDNATNPDVNGIRLEWRDKIAYDKTFAGKYYDQRSFQLFAISGCQDVQPDENQEYGKYIYLPLASYQADYIDGSIITTTDKNANAIFYNWNLGKARSTGSGCIGNDVRDAYRISQYAPVQFKQKDLVVFNSNSSAGAGNLVPIEFKWSKQGYIKEFCDYQLVQNTNTTGAGAGQYYAFGNMLSKANEYTTPAHWKIEFNDTDDEYLATFSPELTEMYGEKVGGSKFPISNLTGEYYFVKKLDDASIEEDGYIKVRAIDVSGYNTGNFNPVFDTLTISCVDHALRFMDLEVDGHFNIEYMKLAILESVFTDRNLTYKIDHEGSFTPPTPIYHNNKLAGYRTYITNIGEGFDDATYLTVYKNYRRYLTDVRETDDHKAHVIPYYNFSVNIDGTEYFLNADTYTTEMGTQRDSVYWLSLSDSEFDLLMDYENQPYEMRKFKFCLPYELDENGDFVKEKQYGDEYYRPVYLQTLDRAKEDYPHLVVAGASTKYVTAVKLDVAMQNDPTNSIEWNIYSVDYSKISRDQVTSWIFGGEEPSDTEWVPLWDAISQGNGGTIEGMLTDYGLASGGVAFVTESKESPVNYGVLTGLSKGNLTFTFEGDTLIGTYAKRPIWYYRVQIPGENKYLTDAVGKSAEYHFTFDGTTNPYGYFEGLMDNHAAYVQEGIDADKDFVQTFGFKYLEAGDKQTFVVVSRANYTDAKPDEYRFLAEVQNHLVFVDNIEDAMVFQFGKNVDGDYVGIPETDGTIAVYGGEGSIRIVNATGLVEIFTVDGRLVKSAEVTGADQTITAPRGLVIVKNNGEVAKVLVK